ncbi:MAG: 50S ribosomal protein L31 [Chloroflexi bacterium HGW-Chloroflexi-5]|jgi:large subunit ribosomal protein L31|nr:MAG: 50S ribosomal protein L31 [Chloroflexi bacterium HGW-Chloroflexi-5]
MRKGIHPTYNPDAKVTCSCGNTWETGSTKKEIRTEVCSKCHPFFTGQQQRMIDIEGQVDRFYKKLQARQEYVEEKKSRETSKVSPDRSVKEIGLPARATEALEKAGLDNIGKLIVKMGEGEAAMLAIEGFGRKSLIDMKKSLRQMGYELPSAADEIVV